jgi:hypothetical protein
VTPAGTVHVHEPTSVNLIILESTAVCKDEKPLPSLDSITPVVVLNLAYPLVSVSLGVLQRRTTTPGVPG